MNREIRFRAWDFHRKQMLEVWKLDCGCFPKPDTLYNLDFDDLFNKSDAEIMQYTGLKDKNGAEIYEGDIVKYYDINSDKYILKTEKVIGQVVYYEERCQFLPQEIVENNKGGHFITHWDFTEELEVIGNIYENPELLKEVK